MNRTPVTSSNINSIGYDPDTKTLQVEFSSGSVYEYYNVPENLYDQLMNANSHGRFLNKEIKPNFRYEEL